MQCGLPEHTVQDYSAWWSLDLSKYGSMEDPVNFHVDMTVLSSWNCQCANYGDGSFPAILADHHDNIEIVL